MDDDISMTQQDGVPYAVVTLDDTCPPSENGHEITASLFPDAEGFVTDTKTILTYDLDLHEGSTVLDAEHPSFTTAQSPSSASGSSSVSAPSTCSPGSTTSSSCSRSSSGRGDCARS